MKRKLKSIKINIKYSFDFEVNRVFNLIRKSDWYAKHYKGKLYLPNFMQKKAIGYFKNLSKTMIKTNLIKEHKPEQYKKISEIIKQQCEIVSFDITNKFLDSKLKIKPEYILFLTKYGTNGSYDLPNVIVINFQEKSIQRILNIIIHEIIHLAIEQSAIKYKLTYLQKEKIVDLIFSNTLPNFYIKQQFPETKDLNKIDKILKQFFWTHQPGDVV